MGTMLVFGPTKRRAQQVAEFLDLPKHNAYSVITPGKLRGVSYDTTIVVVDLYDWPVAAIQSLRELEQMGLVIKRHTQVM